MPWKDDYTVTDEKSLDDDEVAWPGGKRCCFTVVVDLSLGTSPLGVQASDIRGSRAMFGLEDGLAQLLSVFARHDIRATFTVPAVMAAMLGPRLRELQHDGHEIALNG
jgi:peptidoglycan/xylan/chitin deacetylase (PgdA/CDA1 family)